MAKSITDALKQASPGLDPYSAGANLTSPNLMKSGGEANDIIGDEGENGEFSVVDPEDWYKTYPFQFKIVYGDKSIFYTLPIPPDSLSTKMHTASDATPTLGGMVEETSQNKIWSISMAGTTGTAISRSDDADAMGPATKFRNVISTTGLLSGLVGTVNKLNGFGSAVLNGSDPAAVLSGILQTTLPYGSSSVSKKSNGYSEMQRLHRYFYLYSILAERAPDKTSLYFINYKDSQHYRVVVKNFVIQKSANEPFLYRYQLQLKAWDPTGIQETEGLETNRYAGDLKSVNTLTLTGAFSQMVGLSTKIAAGVTGIIPAVI